MELPVDHRIISLKFEQYLRKRYSLALMMPRMPEQFTRDNEEYAAAYTCEVQLSKKPQDLITFVLEYSDKTMLFCKLDCKGNVEPIFGLNFYAYTTNNGELSQIFLDKFIAQAYKNFKGKLSLLK